MQGRIPALLAFVVTSPCLAHHGVAPHYDASKPVHLEGVVAKFDFIHPHSFVYIDVVDGGGATQTWSCEMASRSVLSRNGLTAERFEVGRIGILNHPPAPPAMARNEPSVKASV